MILCIALFQGRNNGIDTPEGHIVTVLRYHNFNIRQGSCL